ncbi:NitT/TauT family transport system ATP-binding protein [Aminobacter aminovorans]|uniref:Bicarbonate transport ATP-binding protein CmpD n=1 Tax=Aminobacter aminovorans TaxID=83263 RepID=A0A381ILW8_AMIAI|nr:ABC transporter ATP-binding protein [Aminobacter aminovorans]TCS25043.1 NitT/TauT family transport system ATP-binding protein [Aminobacter aminovorans]SUY28488.1 Bicarbonate transport ATP-binding protein CmpD [Aminobacter aminovorans]
MIPIVQFEDVSKVFFKGATPIQALGRMSLTVRTGELLAVVGPSGCGKSTLLNMAAGLMKPGTGSIRYKGQAVMGANTQVAYVTQKDNLLPWRTVEQNVRLPLEMGAHRLLPETEKRARVARYIQMVGLAGFEHHYPKELSGGMRKRAQMARSLVYEPDTLLMDEPFGALDAQLKLALQAELLKTWEGSGKTLIFVTHDLTEAISLADRVVVMSGRPGRITAIADIRLPRPRDVFHIRFQPEFGVYFEELWAALKQDAPAGEDRK